MDRNGLSVDGTKQGDTAPQGSGTQQGDAVPQGSGTHQGDVAQQGGATPQSDVSGLIADGEKSPASPAPDLSPPAERLVPARVLVDCEHGKTNDVVELPLSTARAASKAGQICGHPESVEYALKLRFGR